MTSTEPLDWKFCQVFGDRSPVEEVSDVDIVSAVELMRQENTSPREIEEEE